MRQNFPERYSAEVIAQAKAEPLEFVFASQRESEGALDMISRQFQNFAAGELAEKLGENVEAGNFHIYTTMDPELQIAAHRAVTDHLARLDTLVARVRRGLPQEQAGDEDIQAALVAMDAETGEVPAMVGGSAGTEVSAMDLAEGYSLFANNGLKVWQTPLAAVYRDGVKLKLSKEDPVRIAEPGPACVVTQMMRSVLQPGGTASGATSMAGLASDVQVGAKTGTGQVADLWFVGFSRRLVVAVWVGMPRNKPALRMADGFQGASAAMPIWASFIKAVKQHRPDFLEGGFSVPANVRRLNIDPQRGCITKGPGVAEYFIAGREPANCAR